MEDQQQQQGGGGGGGIKQVASSLIQAGPDAVTELIQELSRQLADQDVDFGQLVSEALGGGEQQSPAAAQPGPPGGGPAPSPEEMQMAMAGADPHRGRITIR